MTSYLGTRDRAIIIEKKCSWACQPGCYHSDEDIYLECARPAVILQIYESTWRVDETRLPHLLSIAHKRSGYHSQSSNFAVPRSLLRPIGRNAERKPSSTDFSNASVSCRSLKKAQKNASRKLPTVSIKAAAYFSSHPQLAMQPGSGCSQFERIVQLVDG